MDELREQRIKAWAEAQVAERYPDAVDSHIEIRTDPATFTYHVKAMVRLPLQITNPITIGFSLRKEDALSLPEPGEPEDDAMT